MIGIARSSLPRPTLLLVASIVVSLALSWWGLERLAYARSRLANVEDMVLVGARPRVPLLAGAKAFTDPDRRTAAARFGAALSKAIASHRLLIERLELLPAQPDGDALLTAELALSGSEADIRQFAAAIEGGQPAIRFASWRIARTAERETTVRIEARALALWEPGA